MQFPAPSETFASSDIQNLSRLNSNVKVYSLKSKHKNFYKMVNDRKLQNISIFTCEVKENILGLIEIIKSPFLFVSLLFWLTKNDLKKVAIELFELQYENNGLYGYDISFRMVTDNKSFRVTVFHHGNRDFYMDVKTLDDVKKLKDKIWD